MLYNLPSFSGLRELIIITAVLITFKTSDQLTQKIAINEVELNPL